MIQYLGFKEETLDSITEKLDAGLLSAFEPIDIESIQTEETDLVLIGPDISNPIKYVQQIVHKDKYVSIVVLAMKNEYQNLKQLLQFSPFVGKNTSVVLLNKEVNLTSTVENAISRARQKRSFAKFNAPEKIKLSMLSATLRFDNLGEALENAPIGVMLLDRNGKIIGANRRSKEMFEQIADDPTSLFEIFSSKAARLIQDLIETRSENAVEVEDLHGNYYEVTSSGFNANGTLFLLVNDITETKHRDKRLRSILESLPQISWTADDRGTIEFLSQGWYTYTNQTQGTGISDSWHTTVHPEDLNQFLSRYKSTIQSKRTLEHAVRLRRFNGEYRWHLCRVVPVPTSSTQHPSWAGTFTDIHDQVLVTEELDSRVRERTRLLEERNAELAQFVHVSSHDLQEPLRKIKTFSNMIKDESYDNLSSNSRKFLDKIIATSERMSKLLKDLLSFNSLKGDADMEEVDLNGVVHQAIEDLELIIAQTNTRLEIERMPTLKARALQMKQLFFNLISNSIKYATPGTPPVIHFKARDLSLAEVARLPNLPQNVPYVEIVSKDNGIGFDQEYAEQIFGLFQRLHGMGEYEGNGVGLAICKRIVVNHGGEITATSKPGHGAEFHIILPRSA